MPSGPPGFMPRGPRPFSVQSIRSPLLSTKNGTISGVTHDSSGVVLPSAIVKLFDKNNNLVAQQVSDSVTGAFSFTVPGNGLFDEVAVLPGSPDRAGCTINVTTDAPSTGSGASTIATILGANLQLWYSNQVTGSGATLTWIDEEAHVNITTLGTAPTLISVGTAANVGMRFSGPEDLTNASTFLPGPSAGNPVNRVICGFAFRVTGATTLGAQGDILSAVAQGIGSACLKAAILDTGKLEFTFRANDGSFAIFDSNASLVDSTFHTGISVWDGTAGLAQMYVDNVLQTATGATTAAQRFTDTNEQIVVGDSDSFHGDLLSPFIAWNATGTSYTAAQIAALHSYLIGLTT